MPRKTEKVQAWRCLACDELFEQPEGPVYECGTCGNREVDERRCGSCNKFMAKQGDQSCPHCMDTDIEQTECFRLEDSLFNTVEEAAKWLKENTPAKVKKRQQESDEQMAKLMEERKQVRARRNADIQEYVLPVMKRVGVEQWRIDHWARNTRPGDWGMGESANLDIDDFIEICKLANQQKEQARVRV
jgi:hypothetical protein